MGLPARTAPHPLVGPAGSSAGPPTVQRCAVPVAGGPRTRVSGLPIVSRAQAATLLAQRVLHARRAPLQLTDARQPTLSTTALVRA
jgi:hypothetical protein